VESLADGPVGGFRCHARPVVNATRSARPRASLRLPKDAPALVLSADSVSLKNGSVDPPRCAFLRRAGLGMPPDLQGRGRASASRSWSRALEDPFLDVVAPPAWVRPSPKVRGSVRCSSQSAWGAEIGQHSHALRATRAQNGRRKAAAWHRVPAKSTAVPCGFLEESRRHR
jgi:hypothetical protein